MIRFCKLIVVTVISMLCVFAYLKECTFTHVYMCAIRVIYTMYINTAVFEVVRCVVKLSGYAGLRNYELRVDAVTNAQRTG